LKKSIKKFAIDGYVLVCGYIKGVERKRRTENFLKKLATGGYVLAR